MKHVIEKRYPIGNKRFIWKQKDYVISTFSGFPQSGTHEGDINEVADRYAKNHKEAGFNLLELGWVQHEGSWAAVDACEKNEIDLLFQDMSLMGGMSFRYVDRHCTREEIKAVVDKLKDKKHTIGYYVWDEPKTDEQLTEARRQMDILEELDPEALLFTVAEPDYNFLEKQPGYTWENGKYEPFVHEFAERMDPPVMSFDYYPIGNYFGAWPGHQFTKEKQLDDSHMLLSMALHRKVALEHNLPFWFYYQGYKLYKCTPVEDFIFPMVRCFMYAAVLYGAKGLQNYATGEKGNRFLNPDGSKGDFYEDQKKINFEIKALGNTLMALTSKLIYHSSDLLPDSPFTEKYFDKIDDSSIFGGTLPKRTSVGELEDAYGNRYAVILNRDFEKTLSANLGMKDNFRVYEVSRKDGKQRVIHENVTSLPVELAPGDAVVLRIQKADEEAFTVEYQLAE
ncbi:MAG: hypothetical protein E7395_04980 [Ruminococcaceae bacterium]|nr:hypothetical protein [Oscillospiraceae bacterium]